MSAGGGLHEVASTPGVSELFALMNLIVLFVVIYIFGKNKIKDGLKARQVGIADKLVKTREELKKMRAEIEVARQHLANINKEKEEIIKSVEQEGAALARKLIDEAQATANRIVDDSKLAAKSELQNAQQKLKVYIIEKAIDNGLQKIKNSSDENLNPQKMHKAFIEKFVQELPAKLSQDSNANKGVSSNGHSA